METVSHIVTRAKSQFDLNRPFILYAKPGENKLQAMFQSSDKSYPTEDFFESGFVFAPFEDEHPLLIPENASDGYAVDFSFDTVDFDVSQSKENPEAKAAFVNLVQKGIDAIESGRFAKLVLSRTETVEVSGNDFTRIFKKMLHTYPDAFRYCWFHPETGLWLGATPERLLRTKGREFHTVALAGTRKYDGSEQIDWPEKEKAEQQFVTDFISESLKNKVSEIRFSEPYTARAGNLLHIKTDINGMLDKVTGLKEIVQTLHPTPAVCGLPKVDAKKFILENEGYDREFYSGFLGELNKGIDGGNQGSDLFVNLRCMKIESTAAHLFMGCGITKDSDPEKEFTETVNKSMTMKKILS